MNQNRVDHISQRLLEMFTKYNNATFDFEVSQVCRCGPQKHIRHIIELITGKHSHKMSFVPRANESKEQRPEDDEVLREVTSQFILEIADFLETHAPNEVVMTINKSYATGLPLGYFSVTRKGYSYGKKQLQHFRESLTAILTAYNAHTFDFAVTAGYDPIPKANEIVDVIENKTAFAKFSVRQVQFSMQQNKSQPQHLENEKLLSHINRQLFDEIEEFLLSHVENVSFEVFAGIEMKILNILSV